MRRAVTAPIALLCLVLSADAPAGALASKVGADVARAAAQGASASP